MRITAVLMNTEYARLEVTHCRSTGRLQYAHGVPNSGLAREALFSGSDDRTLLHGLNGVLFEPNTPFSTVGRPTCWFIAGGPVHLGDGKCRNFRQPKHASPSLTFLTSHIPLCTPIEICSGRHVVIIATRTILGKSYARSTKTQGIRPRSRTLTSVQDSMLEVTATCILSWEQISHEFYPHICFEVNLAPFFFFPFSGFELFELGCVRTWKNLE